MDNHYTNFAVSYNYFVMDDNKEALIYANHAMEQCDIPETCDELVEFIAEITEK